MNFLLLLSGFFLGWSLGANDGGNIFGPAVSTRMLKFPTAAIIASVFIILGAVLQGGGATQTLSALGAVNQLSGSCTVAVAAALSLFLMVKTRIPVSSSQAVVGAILGWNIFANQYTGYTTLITIFSAWVSTPILSALFAIFFYIIFRKYYYQRRISLLLNDYYLRMGYITLIAFSAYSLGANNIANVVGMFASSSPFTPINVLGKIIIPANIQLFFLGGISIAVGILTRSMNNAQTIGQDIYKMSPTIGFIAILSSSLVLFLFSSKNLQILLDTLHLPTLPLVPASSSQAIVGAIIGLGIIKNANQIQYKKISKIALGWIINPILSGLICFVSLFFVQNVFNQKVYTPAVHRFNYIVLQKLESIGVDTSKISELNNQIFDNPKQLKQTLASFKISYQEQTLIAEYGEYFPIYLSSRIISQIKEQNFFPEQYYLPFDELENEYFDYRWQLSDKFSEKSEYWRYKPQKRKNDFYNSELNKRYELLFRFLQKEIR